MEYLISAVYIPAPGFRSLGNKVRAFGLHIKDHFVPHARNNYHPHILGTRTLHLFSGALVSLKILSIALLSFGPVLPAFSEAISVPNIIALTNQSRLDYGLNSLTENALLDKAAQAKADDMLAKGYFSHTTPDGQTPWSFINDAGYNYLMAGENLAVNFWEAENVEQAWMNSPGHKANILNKNFEEIGIGISQGEYQGHNAIFVVQMFGVPMQQKVQLANAPTSVQQTSVPAPVTVNSLPQQPVVKMAQSNKSSLETKTIFLPAPLSVVSAGTELSGNKILVTAQISGPAVKAFAYFGDKAVMLSPKQGGKWQGEINVSELASGSLSVSVKAYDLNGAAAELKLADFSRSTVNNFHVLNSGTTPEQVKFLGLSFDPKSTEQRIYLIFVAGILSSLLLAIGLKRHVQHINLIANSSLVIMLACLLFMAG